MKQKRLTLFLALGAVYLQAQEIRTQDTKTALVSGYVTDAETGERLSDAHVRIGVHTALTNLYGFYSLRVSAGLQTATISYIGYTPHNEDILFRSDTLVSIALKAGLSLSEIVVTSNKMRNVEDKGLGNLRVNLSQLSVSPLFLGERDIIKAMQFLPGVSSGMEGSSNLNIRGGTNDQTLYLMDDAPVYNQNHTFGLISIFNADALLSADIYKGGLPAMYGNRLSGVASVSLKDGNMKSHRQSVGIGLLAGTLSAEGPIVKDKVSYLFSARRSILDLLFQSAMSLAMGGEVSAPMVSFWDINGKATWKMTEKTRLSFSIYNGNDNLGAFNKTKDEETNDVMTEKAGFGWMTTTASMRLTSGLRPNIFLSSSLYYSQLDNFNYFNVKTNDIKLNQRQTSRLQELGWRTSIENRPSNHQTLFVGYDVSVQYYEPTVMVMEDHRTTNKINIGTKRLLTASAFAYDELKWRNWMFAPGMRFSFYQTEQRGKFAVEPRLKLSTFVDDDNRLMFAYDRTTQPVHSVNEMNYSVKTDYWLPFNEDRLPTADQLSVGWKNYSVRNVTLSVEAYYKTMRRLILIRDLENYMDFHADYETGTGRSMGMEWLIQYDRERFNTWLSYTLSKSERTFGGRTSPFKYDAPHDVSLFASYVVRKKGNTKKTLSANVQYRSGLPYYVSEMSYPDMSYPDRLLYSRNSDMGVYISDVNYIPYYPNTRISDFFRADLNFTSEKKLKRGVRTWQLSLLNVTGHQNPYHVYRKNGRYKAFILIPFMPSFSVKWEF
ncbi:MAG: TonB-dependent receptor [Tannerella sp.]|jgi:hypothetical protein|nr:TonB-dependent receptor [Tannerella sp.]